MPTDYYIDTTGIDTLKDSLAELAKIAIPQIGMPTVEQLIFVPGEEITEAPLSNEDILNLVCGLEPKDPKDNSITKEAEPEVSLSTGLQAVLDLDVLISQKYPGQFDNLCLDLQKLCQTLHWEVQANAKQMDIQQFFYKK